MNRRIVSIGIVCVFVSVTLVASAQAQSKASPGSARPAAPAGTAFTYRGQLKNGNTPVNGSCDIAFRIYDADSNGNQVGSTLEQTVAITAGLFTTALDFGAGVFTGDARWLDLQVRCPAGSGDYTQLTPRQSITSVPYAQYATGPWATNGSDLTYGSGNIGIGTTTPAHHLSIAGGPLWTSNNWSGALELTNSSAIGWQADNLGSRFGLGQSTGGLYFFHTASDPGTTASPATYDVVINDVGKVGIGTTVPNNQLTVNGAADIASFLRVGGNTGGSGLAGDVVARRSANTGAYYFGDSASNYLYFDGSNYRFGQGALSVNITGNVGIGVTNPVYPLQVLGRSGDGVDFRVESAAGPVFRVWDDGTVSIGKLYGIATTQHACFYDPGFLRFVACSSAAEYVPTVEGGAGIPDTADLVSIAPSAKNPYGDEHAPFVVTKSAKPCDSNLLGFIVKPESGADGKKLNDHYLPLAIYGYFPAKVTLENGPIHRGDPLTSSSRPGYGMKATQACKIIGYALEDANQEGTIQVFANHGESAAPEVATLRAKVQGLEDQNQKLMEQNAALDARLTALEQKMSKLTK